MQCFQLFQFNCIIYNTEQSQNKCQALLIPFWHALFTSTLHVSVNERDVRSSSPSLAKHCVSPLLLISWLLLGECICTRGTFINSCIIQMPMDWRHTATESHRRQLKNVVFYSLSILSRLRQCQVLRERSF